MKTNVLKKLPTKWLAALLSILMVIAFTVQTANATSYEPIAPTTVDLMAGQSIDAGDVSVWNDTENLYVKYETQNGWMLKQNHLAVGTALTDIPQTKGKKPVAIPGQFAYSNSFDPTAASYTYTIPLNSLDASYNDILYVATHAVVVKPLSDGTYQQETGWGSGNKFGGAWGMYFNYTIQQPQVSGGYTTYTSAGSAWGTGEDFGTGISDYFVFDDFSTDKTVVLGMGRNEINVGSVTAHLDADTQTINVTYSTMDPYFMDQTHVYVGGAAPTSSAPGSYADQYTVSSGSEYFQTHTFTINLLTVDANEDGVYDFDTNKDGIVDGNQIYIAAHAHIYSGSN
jgi:hypothetical protein